MSNAKLAKIDIPEKEKTVLRNLAEKQAKIASLPVHKTQIAEWTRLNDNKPGRPLVWINEIPWHEMNVNDELTLQTTTRLCRRIEDALRKTIYQWEHMPADMIVEPVFYSPLEIHNTGFGIKEDVEIERTDANSGIVSRGFHSQIDSEADIAKIKDPVVTHNAADSELVFNTYQDIFDGILKVEKQGVTSIWFAPWDELIRWWDVQKALMDLVMRPELVHMAMDRLTNAFLARLKQYCEQNLLSYAPGNFRIGSGGLAYTTSLPGKQFDPAHVRTMDHWGNATAQIFSEVSPEMHEEFALNYELKWMEQFGLNYYGCCEPLHNKIDILKKIPRLRKISMSPWCDVDKMIARTAGAYVLSHKPNPAVLATDTWNPAQARKNLVEVMEKTGGLAVEVIMKDVSTVRYQPQRLWEWSRMAMDIVGR